MNELMFWREWDNTSRNGLISLSVVAFLLVCASLFLVFSDYSFQKGWEITGELSEVSYPIYSNHDLPIESQLFSEVSLLFQKFSGTLQQTPSWIPIVYYVIFSLSLLGCLTVCSYLDRFWFFVSMAAFIFLVAVGGIGQVGFLGLERELSVALFSMLFIALAFYFNSLNNNITFGFRFLYFVILKVVCISSVFIFSDYPSPLLFLSYYSFFPSVLLSVLFILLVGHEIIYSILVLTTQSSKADGSGNAKHFSILSLAYLINVFLIYGEREGLIDWDLYYINAFFLLTISTLVGVWGLKKRDELYHSTLPFYFHGAFLYLFMAIGCFSTLSFFLISENDPALDLFETAIVYGHLCFGIFFFLYIIVNFIGSMINEEAIYKIVFQENNLPYATSRIAGFIAVIGLLALGNFSFIKHSIAGYYNGIADANMILGNRELAKKYYGEGAIYSGYNNKSHYSLSFLQDEIEEKIDNLSSAIRRRPSEQLFTNLGMAYEDDLQFFKAMFAYQDGLKTFPDSKPLKNNLALLYGRTDVSDSAVFYLRNDDNDGWMDAVLASNLIGMSAAHEIVLDKSVGRNHLTELEKVDVQSNLLAYELLMNRLSPISDEKVIPDFKHINLYTYSYLKNLGLALSAKKDDDYLSIIDLYLGKVKGAYAEELSLIKAISLFENGFVLAAFGMVKNMLISEVHDEAMLNVLLGKWSMEMGDAQLASKYFGRANELNYPLAIADLSVAFQMTGNGSVAQFFLDKEIMAQSDTLVVSKLNELHRLVSSDQGVWLEKKGIFDDLKQIELTLKTDSLLDEDQTNLYYDKLGSNNPFYVQGVLASIRYFNETNNKDKAYKTLQNAIEINPYEVRLLKVYISQSMKMGLDSYAESSLLKLKELMSEDDFLDYKLAYETEREFIQAENDKW